LHQNLIDFLKKSKGEKMTEYTNNSSTDFSYLDQYTAEEIANFKSAAKLKSIESIHSEKYHLEKADVCWE
jgi:uncharacterized iron-regulated membrane protein